MISTLFKWAMILGFDEHEDGAGLQYRSGSPYTHSQDLEIYSVVEIKRGTSCI